VAVKVLSAKMAKNSEMRSRFRREAGVSMSLDHPNIVAGIEAEPPGVQQHREAPRYGGEDAIFR